MDSSIFTYTDLSDGDHEITTMKYVGEDAKNSICFVAVSPSACAFFSSITEDMNPVGFFIVTVHDILNPIEYANGQKPIMKFVRSIRNEVFKIQNLTLVSFEHAELCVHQCVNSVFETINPESIYILHSNTKSEFPCDVEVPYLYFLPSETEEQRIPIKNQIKGIAAGLLTIGEIQNVKVQVCQLVEDDIGSSVESMYLWSKFISKHINIDPEMIAKHANLNAKIRAVNQNGVFT